MIEHALLPAFGDRPLDTISPDAVNAFLAAQSQAGLKPKTLRNQLALLSKLLTDAREANHVAVNRIAGSRAVRRPRALKAEDEAIVEAFTPEEINRLLDAIDPRYQLFAQTWVSTGLRPGEIIGVQWGDLDRHAKLLHIRRTHYKGADLVLKTRSSRRSDLGDQLLAALGGLARERFGDNAIDLEAPVFVTPEGGRIEPNNFRTRTWMAALAKAGLAYRKPYALRQLLICC